MRRSHKGELKHQRDWLSMRHSFIDVSFHVEHYPWIQAWCVPRSISKSHAGGRSQTENKGTRLGRDALSPSLPPPLSTCLCAGLLLISEALSFVSVRCPKDCGMKRDTWRVAGRLWLRCVTTHTHSHRNCHRWVCQTLLASRPSSSAFPPRTQLPLPAAASLETRVEPSGGTWCRGWNLIETALNWGRVRGATEQLSAAAWLKIDEALNRLRCRQAERVCVFLGW